MNLTSASDLAASFGIDEAKLHTLRRRNNWPCVRLGRFDIRFTDAQIEQIVQIQSRATGSKPKVGGQTARSARRSA